MPCLTTEQILNINNFLNQVISTLTEWSQPGSRFYELDAYSFLGGFLPCGRVPKADDEIFAANQRIQNLNDALAILANATEDTTQSEGEEETDSCAQLVAAINALSAKLDLTTTINNALNAFIPILIAALQPKFDTVNNNIDNSTDIILSGHTTINENVNDVKIGINDTRIELREARERLIVIQSENRGIEILERIHDTRTELREARERLIVVEDCVCPRIEIGENNEIDVDDLIARLMAEINIALERNAILIFDSLYYEIGNMITNLEARLNVKIDSPAWLPGINAKLDLIIELLKKLDEIIAFLKDLDVYLRGILGKIALDIEALINIANNIDASVSSIQTALSLLNQTINQLENNVEIIRNLLNQLSNVTNNILNQVQNLQNTVNNQNVDLTPVLLAIGGIVSLINSLQQDVDRLQPPNIAGSTNSNGCLITQTYSYGGIGFNGISSQLSSLSSQINSLHSELCPIIQQEQEIIEGELVNIDCENPDNIITTSFSGNGLRAIVAGLETNSNNLVKIHQEICKQKAEEPNCFVVVPSDVDEELPIPKQLIIHWRVDNIEEIGKVSKWQSTIPLPISNLNWQTHFENLRWVRGNVTGRWYLQNSTARLGGYFETEQNAIDTLNQLIQLTTLEPKTTLPRITKNSSTFIQSVGVVTRPYKAVIVEKQGNQIIPIQCFTPNN